MKGERILKADLIGTIAFAVSATLAAISPDWFGWLGFAVAIALFVAGVGAFIAAYARAVDRSRTDAIGIGGWFFLSGSAPRPVQLRLNGLLAAQVVIALATASARPFTSLAFGVLSPVYGLALNGLWAARYGTFPLRAQDRTAPARRARPEPRGRDEPDAPDEEAPTA